MVETSQILVDWTPVLVGDLMTLDDTTLTYTLPKAQDKWFVRLVVTPNQAPPQAIRPGPSTPADGLFLCLQLRRDRLILPQFLKRGTRSVDSTDETDLEELGEKPSFTGMKDPIRTLSPLPTNACGLFM